MQIEIPAQAGQVLAIVKPLFGGSLLGFYLYGSATYGGLHPDSDVDLLAVLDRPMTDTERKSLTAALLACSGRVGCADKRPLEVTVVDRAAASGFPPVYEYMYGEWLRAAMESGDISGACADPDLALLLWQAQTYGVPLYGGALSEWIEPVSPADIRRAIAGALPALLQNLVGDERNVLLTLARMWFTLETGALAAKDKAAAWALTRVPPPLSEPLRLARSGYLGECREDWRGRDDQLRPLVRFLKERIEQLAEAGA